MKKIISIVTVAAILCLLTPTVMGKAPSVNVSDCQITDNINPGDNFQIMIRLSNPSDNDAEDVGVQLKASYPISAIGIYKKHLNDLNQNEEEKLEFQLRAEETAIEGSYPVEFLINYEDSDGNKYSKSYVVNVFIEGKEELSLHLTESSKTDLYSDESASLTFVALNKGSVELDSLVAEASAEGPLKVKWNSKNSVIGKLSPQESVNIPVKVETAEGAETDNYSLKIRLSGENYEFEKVFKIPVKGLPSLKLESIGAENIYPGKKNVKAVVHLSNEGSEEAKEIEGRLLPKYPFSTEETTQYAQSLEPGETNSMTFWLDVDEDGKEGTYSLELSLDYEAWGEDFSKTLKIPLSVEGGNTLSFQLWWLIPIFLVIIIGGYAARVRL